jgi:KDO2-lipid IV(A) lauroyltransferase
MSSTLYLLAWRILPFIPESITYSIAKKFSKYIYRKNSISVQRLRKNYQVVHPEYSDAELEELVKAGISSYLRYWIEAFSLNSWSKERILDSVEVKNEYILDEALAAKRGVVVAISHSANWDLAGAYYSLRRSKVVTVAEQLEPRKLFEKFLAYRESLGMEIFPLHQRTLVKLFQRAREGNIIALLADRDLTANGVPVNFIGKPSSMPVGPALIAYETGAALLTANIYYADFTWKSKMVIEFQPEILMPANQSNAKSSSEDNSNEASIERNKTSEESFGGDKGSEDKTLRDLAIQSLTSQLANRFTENLKAHTADWHMMQKVWENL